MKKWHLEGVLGHITPKKLILSDLDPTAVARHSTLIEFHQESKLISCCRKVAAFLIRVF
jgi:hypothetical protein